MNAFHSAVRNTHRISSWTLRTLYARRHQRRQHIAPRDNYVKICSLSGDYLLTRTLQICSRFVHVPVECSGAMHLVPVFGYSGDYFRSCVQPGLHLELERHWYNHDRVLSHAPQVGTFEYGASWVSSGVQRTLQVHTFEHGAQVQ
jgi:hypothetical protein